MAQTVTRLTSSGTYYTTGIFDDASISPILDSSLRVLFDAGNPASYPGTGTTWYDISGNGYVATLTNTPVYTTSTGYFSFNGTNQYASTSYLQPAYQTSDSFTWNVWISTALLGGSTAMTIGNRNYSSSPAYDFTKINNNLNFEYYHSGTNVSVAPTGIALNTWYNMCIVKNTGTISYYVNGVFNNSTSASQSSSNFPQAFWIGGDPGAGEYGNARISVVSIYNRALTLDEIRQNFNSLAPRFGVTAFKSSSTHSITSTTVYAPLLDEVTGMITSNSLVAYWNAGSVNSYPGYGAKWSDLSNFRNDITLSGTYVYNTGTSFNMNATGYATNTSNLISGLASSATAFSVSVWFNYNTTASYTAVFEKQTSVGGGIPRMDIGYIGGGTNLIYWTTWYQPTAAVNDMTYGTIISTGTWCHIVLTCNAAGQKIGYLNGQPVASSSFTSSWPDASQILGVGGYNRKINGQIGQTQIYNKTLTSAEVLDLYNSTKTVFGIAGTAPAKRETTSSLIVSGGFDEVTGMIITNGLQLYLDGGNVNSYARAGVIWNDLSNNAYRGQMTNISYTSTSSGLVFASGSYADLTTNCINSNADFTINFWCNPTANAASTPYTLLASYSVGGSLQIRFYNNAVNLVKNYVANIASFTGFTAGINTNYYITVQLVKSTNTWILYVNGTYISSFVSSQSFNINAPAIGTNIGGGESFVGTIFSVSHYNRVLTAAEIAENFNQSRGIFGV
jgi:hypothetical protein